MGQRIKKFNELTNELQRTIKEAKEKLLNAILNDNEISKVEKLQLISDNDLFGSQSWICDPFEDEYHSEYLEQLKSKGITNPIVDDYIQHQGYSRYETVYMVDLVENIAYAKNEDDLITIYTNRNTNDKFKISRYEFIDAVYDWCVKNKIISFVVDW